MRFNKGSKVEVMGKTQVPISWCCAKIISGNGHSYKVKFDGCPGSPGQVVERVCRKAIRPSPPAMNGRRSWVAGDVVEVFNYDSWKSATVLKVLFEDYYLVRLLGVFQELRVHKSTTRVPQSWLHDNWVIIGKGSGNGGLLKSYKPSSSNCYQMLGIEEPGSTKTKWLHGDDYSDLQNDGRLPGSHMVSSRTLKRASPYCSSLPDAYTGHVQKKRAIKKDARCQRIVSSQLREKVDAVSYPRENLGEKNMHSSFNNRSNGHYDVDRANMSSAVACTLARISEPCASDSDACSVGSCSIASKSPNRFPSYSLAVPCQDTATISSDAESVYGSGNDETCPFPQEEEAVTHIHRLELHAYRCTLEALYASGPLSWEQEALLTNLRTELNISNDEHLMELRTLLSVRSKNSY